MDVERMLKAVREQQPRWESLAGVPSLKSSALDAAALRVLNAVHGMLGDAMETESWYLVAAALAAIEESGLTEHGR